MKMAYLAWDLWDAATVRRVQMLQAGGAEIAVAGFRRRDEVPAYVSGVRPLDLGRTFDGRLAHRAALVASTSLRLARLRDVVRGADVVLARNLEMLAVAAAARRAFAPRAKLVYECLDIHRLMCGSGGPSAALRALEAALLRSCSAVIVSAPAFISEYFERYHPRLPHMLLVENKLLSNGQRPAVIARQPGPPWRIGWFGNVRCRNSVELLKEIARRAQGAIEVVIRGRPSAHTLADLDALIAGAPHVRFGGAYTQADLEAIYGEVHFAWSLDFTDEGQNSDWLLPNRIYEGSFFNTPSIAERGKAIGAWLAEKGAGLLVDDPVSDIVRTLGSLTPDDYRLLENRTASVDTRALAVDTEACRALVLTLGSATLELSKLIPKIHSTAGQ
jgi:succinoglycan biosynthesis protein ExoL